MLFIPFLYYEKYYIASLLHGCLCCLCCYFDQSKLLLWNSLIYFIIDIYRPNGFNRLDMLFHHLFPIVGILIVFIFFSQECIEFGSKILCIFEISNPLWVYLRLRLMKSEEIPLPQWYTKLFAGIFFMSIFGVTRFIYLPLYLYWYLPPCADITIISCLLIPILLLSTYWYFLLIKGGIKEFNKC